MTPLNQPLVWMDAVEHVRGQKAAAVPTVEDLATDIQTFYATNALALTAEEATEAAQQCLAAPEVFLPVVQVPWDRPATVIEWEAQKEAAQRRWVRYDRVSDGVCIGVLGGLGLAGLSAGTLTGLHHAQSWWQAAGLGLAGALAGALVAFVFMGLTMLSPMLRHQEKLKNARHRLDPMQGTEADLIALDTWMTIPEVARWLAQLRHGPVPMLQGDLQEVRDRAPDEAKKKVTATIHDQFTARLDAKIAQQRAAKEITP